MPKYEVFKDKKVNAEELYSILKNANYPVTLPINIEHLIKFLEIQIEMKPDFKKMKVLGSIAIKNGKPVIWVNKIANPIEERRRFTLAHELGHFMLHIAPLSSWDNELFVDDDNAIGFNRDDQWDYKEMEANNFAAQLLMPKEALNDLIINNEKPENRVERLSKIFHVSKIAMKYRLESLGWLK